MSEPETSEEWEHRIPNVIMMRKLRMWPAGDKEVTMVMMMWYIAFIFAQLAIGAVAVAMQSYFILLLMIAFCLTGLPPIMRRFGAMAIRRYEQVYHAAKLNGEFHYATDPSSKP